MSESFLNFIKEGLSYYIHDLYNKDSKFYNFLINKLFFSNFRVFEDISDLDGGGSEIIIGLKGRSGIKNSHVLIASTLKSYPLELLELPKLPSTKDKMFPVFTQDTIFCPGIHTGVIDILIKLYIASTLLEYDSFVALGIAFAESAYNPMVQVMKNKLDINFSSCLIQAPSNGEIVEKSNGVALIKFTIFPSEPDLQIKLFKKFFQISFSDLSFFAGCDFEKQNSMIQFLKFFKENNLWHHVHVFNIKGGKDYFYSPSSIEAIISTDNASVFNKDNRFVLTELTPDSVSFPLTEHLEMLEELLLDWEIKEKSVYPTIIRSEGATMELFAYFSFANREQLIAAEQFIDKKVQLLKKSISAVTIKSEFSILRTPYTISNESSALVEQLTNRKSAILNSPTQGAYTETPLTFVLGPESGLNIYNPQAQSINIDKIIKTHKFYKKLMKQLY